ncbi:Zn-dependent exopeptidase [Cylindrobasidium torrendii FP15055 ss-10]|uniref:Peptide hydrolase n=1 Tax=Cylindrobasidium torrendii FP15055 ss-10 TaxID=1314674 RepID=A0A0D7AWK2_9AGAR|nr:Zn-dependent exopeptidase [Cylindrobasidium torrendii FP15055 ss-10]
MKFSTAACVLAATAAYAAPSIAEVKEKAADGLRLIRTSPGAEIWVSEDEKLEYMRNHTRFFDITETAQKERPSRTSAKKAAAFPTGASKQDTVNPLLETLSIDNLKSTLATLGDFNNRYYKADTGAEASKWIVDTLSDIASGSEATAKQFNHSFVQSSIIAHIPGSSDGPVTIIGAHMDSINLQNPQSGRAPGQDDNGSGSTNLIEIFRALVEGGYTPATPVELMWYAGEEAGLLGSQDIAAQYASDNVEVQAVLNLDMTGYFKPNTNETVALITDNTDTDLTAFVGALVDEYLSFGWTESQCGYACSDHASWDGEGYPAAFPFETVFGTDNPNIHSSGDTTEVNGFSFEHSLEFAKLGLAYIVELSAA